MDGKYIGSIYNANFLVTINACILSVDNFTISSTLHDARYEDSELESGILVPQNIL